ncbi:MAG: hypothetical protein ABFC18_03135 [Rikenellaceae bacterium]
MAKTFVIVKGKVVRMNEAAYKIASRHFGATKNRPEERRVPLELLRIPKIPIVPGKSPFEKKDITPEVIEVPKAEPTRVDPLPVPDKIEAKAEVQAEVKEVKPEPKKRGGRR